MVSTLFRRDLEGENLFSTCCEQRQVEFQIMLDVKLPSERGLHNQLHGGHAGAVPGSAYLDCLKGMLIGCTGLSSHQQCPKWIDSR